VFECFSGDAPDAIERKSQHTAAFERALGAFETGDFETARAAFTKIAFADVGDGSARHYLERCENRALVGETSDDRRGDRDPDS